jgi:hypothetical protein
VGPLWTNGEHLAAQGPQLTILAGRVLVSICMHALPLPTHIALALALPACWGTCCIGVLAVLGYLLCWGTCCVGVLAVRSFQLIGKNQQDVAD